MLLITQVFTFFFISFIILFNIRSITNDDDFNVDLSIFEEQTHDSSLFSPYSRITLQQQLKSRLPNLNEPLRDLTIGKLNFLHTTDTHGWYLGHLNQKQYSSDWGDFISFHSNLLEGINNQGSDLLMVDSGDRHDGNGLSDLTDINGELSSKIFMMLDYDLITVGNHELYKEEISKLEFENVVPRYGENFISTNVEYKNDDDEWVIFGNNTHRYFETKINKFKILAFSFMFDFTMGNDRVRVTPIRDIIKQDWLIELMDDYSKNYEIDSLVIVGHIPITHDWLELDELHQFLRSYFPTTYIQYLGGHSHIRDFTIYDNLSTGLQSGRYCETVGFVSIKDLPTSNDVEKLNDFVSDNVHRKYIDFNLHSFMHHSNHTNLETFNTEKGLFVSKELGKISKQLRLDDVFGKVPHSYYMSAADYQNREEKSLLRFLEDEILVQLEPKACNNKIGEVPEIITSNADSNDRIILINTGGIRYDLYKGDFTRNALFTVSPFKNMWKILPSIPTEIALRLQPILNKGSYILNTNENLKSPYQYALESKYSNFEESNHVITTADTDDTINEVDENDKAVFTLNPYSNSHINTNNEEDNRLPLSYGYTTTDENGIHGDDTIHKKLTQFYVPNVIQSHEFAFEEAETTSKFTDVVFYDFIEPFVLSALKEACNGDEELYNKLSSNCQFYNDCSQEYNLGQLLKNYAQDNWN